MARSPRAVEAAGLGSPLDNRLRRAIGARRGRDERRARSTSVTCCTRTRARCGESAGEIKRTAAANAARLRRTRSAAGDAGRQIATSVKKRKGSGAMYSRTVVASRDVRSARGPRQRAEKLQSGGGRRSCRARSTPSCRRALKATRGGSSEPARSTFSTCLIRARDLVRDCAPVRRAFQQRFKFILVDEFQDTDPLQAELLLMLAADDHGRTRRGALFIVGDPKQSIYRFRRADVGIYQQVCDGLQQGGAPRRSTQTVVPQRSQPAAICQRVVSRRDAARRRLAAGGLRPARETSRRRSPGSRPSLRLPVPRPYARLSHREEEHRREPARRRRRVRALAGAGQRLEGHGRRRSAASRSGRAMSASCSAASSRIRTM